MNKNDMSERMSVSLAQNVHKYPSSALLHLRIFSFYDYDYIRFNEAKTMLPTIVLGDNP